MGTDTKNMPRDYPSNVRVTADETGLPKDTVFLCFQIRSLDPGRFREFAAGAMPAARMQEIERALKAVLELS